MRMWIVDDAGYPTGFAGGKISALSPDLRMQALVAEKVNVPAGASFDRSISPDAVAVTALRTDDAGHATAVQLPIGHVLFVGNYPTLVAGRPTLVAGESDRGAAVVSSEVFRWATLVPVTLAPTPTPPARAAG